MKRTKPFFIIGHPRSGTTAVVKWLDLADNAEVYSESPPKLAIESRVHAEHGLPYAKEYIHRSTKNKINIAQQNNKVFGDKNLNYLFFVKELVELYDPYFIFVFRDGRDSVRSILEADKRGMHYFNRFEDSKGSNVAIQPEDDFWDYSRIRPHPKEAIYQEWQNLSKFEQCCWHWTRYNTLLLECISQLPQQQYKIIQHGRTNLSEIENIYQFLSLETFNAEKVKHLMQTNINSVTDKFGKKNTIPQWQDWQPEQMDIFNKHCQLLMTQLGFL